MSGPPLEILGPSLMQRERNVDIYVVGGVGLSVHHHLILPKECQPTTTINVIIEGKLSSVFMGCISVTNNFISMRNNIVGRFFSLGR